MDKAGIREVAKAAGVSISTVSRAFAHPEVVSEKTRHKVLQAADQLDFNISRSAAALKSGQTFRVALLMNEEITSWFNTQIFAGINSIMHDAGYDISVFQHIDTADMRRKAKTANFGIIYGISVFGLAERMGVSRQEAKELIDGYFETYPQVKEYMDKSIRVAREQGYVETIFHRKRFLPDINSRNGVVRGYAERNAINAPIQGSAADIIKVAMAHIYQRFQAYNLKAKMILQVHDELNFSVPEAEKELVQKIVIEEMEQAYRMHVPLKADCGWGNNWLQAHKTTQ